MWRVAKPSIRVAKTAGRIGNSRFLSRYHRSSVNRRSFHSPFFLSESSRNLFPRPGLFTTSLRKTFTFRRNLVGFQKTSRQLFVPDKIISNSRFALPFFEIIIIIDLWKFFFNSNMKIDSTLVANFSKRNKQFDRLDQGSCQFLITISCKC